MNILQIFNWTGLGSMFESGALIFVMAGRDRLSCWAWVLGMHAHGTRSIVFAEWERAKVLIDVYSPHA